MTHHPLNSVHSALRGVLKMVSRVQLEHGANALGLVKSLDFLRVSPYSSHNGIAGFVLFVSQREIQAVRPALHFMGENVFLDIRKPQGTGYACPSGKPVRLIEGIHRKQAGQ